MSFFATCLTCFWHLFPTFCLTCSYMCSAFVPDMFFDIFSTFWVFTFFWKKRLRIKKWVFLSQTVHSFLMFLLPFRLFSLCFYWFLLLSIVFNVSLCFRLFILFCSLCFLLFFFYVSIVSLMFYIIFTFVFLMVSIGFPRISAWFALFSLCFLLMFRLCSLCFLLFLSCFLIVSIDVLMFRLVFYCFYIVFLCFLLFSIALLLPFHCWC